MMRRISAQRITATGKSILRGIFLCTAILTLFSAVCTNEAEGGSRGLFESRRYYTLSFDVDLGYKSKMRDSNDMTEFKQSYTLGLTGFMVDPRLAHFGVKTSFSDSSWSSGVEDKTVGGISLNMSFLNSIDETRGIKLWKYMPKPIEIHFSYYTGTGITSLNYGFATRFTRPGYIRVLSDRKILSYDDGKTSGQRNANQYRVKYGNYNEQGSNRNWNRNGNGNWNQNGNGNWSQNGNGNWNRNGNGNWNRNGNGNWNRNGNGNWNRNGNGNWNRNGNGNWNQNSNGNWNRNGNGNWNRNGNGNWNRNGNGNWNQNGNGNWNRNGNGNWNQNNGGDGNQNNGGNWSRNENNYNPSGWNINRNNLNSNFEKRNGLFYFRFPLIFLNYRRNETELDNSRTRSRGDGNLMMIINNPAVKVRNKKVYDSRYDIRYKFTEIDESTAHDVTLSAENNWGRFRTLTRGGYRTGFSDSNSYDIKTNLSYKNVFRKKWDYTIRGTGQYRKTDSKSTFNYGLSLNGGSDMVKEIRFSPTLRAVTKADAGYSRSEGDSGRGVNAYSLQLTENVISTYFRRAILSAEASTGYSQSGIPLSLRLEAVSRKLDRMALKAKYAFNTYFPSKGEVRRNIHSFEVNGSFRIKPSLSLQSQLRTQITSTDNGDRGSSRTNTTFRNIVIWRISARTSLSGDARIRFTDINTYYHVEARCNTRMIRKGSLSFRTVVKWNDNSAGTSQEYIALYTFGIAKFRLHTGYTYRQSMQGASAHEVMVNVRRSFERRYARLF